MFKQLAILIGLLSIFSGALEAAQSVTLAWNQHPEHAFLQEFRLYYGTNSRTYSWIQSAGTNYTSTVTNLGMGTTYYFAVTAVHTNTLESDFSNEVSYRVPGPFIGPQPPRNLRREIHMSLLNSTRKIIAASRNARSSLGTFYEDVAITPVSKEGVPIGSRRVLRKGSHDLNLDGYADLVVRY